MMAQMNQMMGSMNSTPNGRPQMTAAGVRGPVIDDDEPDPDEPAIPPGNGVVSTGKIRDYGAKKGFGFIKVDGMKEDIFFPRTALPAAFQGQDARAMPKLQGVMVSFQPPPDNGRVRTEQVNLLLKYHAP